MSFLRPFSPGRVKGDLLSVRKNDEGLHKSFSVTRSCLGRRELETRRSRTCKEIKI